MTNLQALPKSGSYDTESKNRSGASSLQNVETQNHRKRTLLFVSNAFSYGGTEKHILELLNRLEDRNVQSVILCTDSDPFSERLKDEVRARVAIRFERSLKSIGDWRRVFQEIKPDVVLLVYGTLWILPWFAAAAARLAGVQELYAIQQLMPQPPPEPGVTKISSPRDVLRRVFGRRVRRIFSARIPPNLCKKTICVSNAVRDALIRQYKFPARKMVTIYNGIDPREFTPNPDDREAIRQKLRIGPDDFVLVCTARLSREKGIDILISAISQVAKKNPSCKAVIIGEGSLKEKLADQAHSLGISGHIFFEGFQPDVRPYLYAADAFVLTSHIEGLPFSVIEAMACGLPCIVTNVGGNAEAVVHKVNGLVVNPGSVDDVAQAILYLLSHPEEHARMARASRSRAQQEFDIEPRMADMKRLILS
jgi:glycosyltransferase involved in cell wall biosynthesis